jgi:hypothetical protein
VVDGAVDFVVEAVLVGATVEDELTDDGADPGWH